MAAKPQHHLEPVPLASQGGRGDLDLPRLVSQSPLPEVGGLAVQGREGELVPATSDSVEPLPSISEVYAQAFAAGEFVASLLNLRPLGPKVFGR